MSNICVCRYPLLIIDSRDSQPIEFIAMPVEVVGSQSFTVPDIDYTQLEGLDGIIRTYVSVKWQELDHSNFKKYDVVGHIVVAGCQPSDSIEEDGKLVCDTKEIYEVLHPLDEWMNRHIIEIPLENE